MGGGAGLGVVGFWLTCWVVWCLHLTVVSAWYPLWFSGLVIVGLGLVFRLVGVRFWVVDILWTLGFSVCYGFMVYDARVV